MATISPVRHGHGHHGRSGGVGDDESSPAPAVPSVTPVTPSATPATSSNRRHSSYGHTDRMTPARSTRLEEKADLQELNRRLEHYILLQREKDASTAGAAHLLQQMKDQYEEKMRLNKVSVETTIAELQRLRSDNGVTISRLEGDNATKQNELDRLAKERDSERNRRIGLEARTEQLTKDLTLARTNLFSAEENERRASHLLEIERAALKAARAELDRARERAEVATESNVHLESRAQAAEGELHLVRQQTTIQVDTYKQQVQELSQAASRSEDEIRAEFANQLKEELADRQAQFDEDKERGFADLKKIYDEKMHSYRSSLEQLSHELDLERARTKQVLASMSEMKTQVAEAMANRRALQQRIAELEQDLRTARDTPNQELREKNEIIRRLKAAFARKDREMDELIDVKIALSMEIKAYQTLLENEEERLGLTSPIKKRKTRPSLDPEGKDGSSRLSLGATPSTMSSLLISGTDVHGSYITIRNGGVHIVHLGGWTLRSSVRRREFKFPASARLRPGEPFMLRTRGPEGSEAKDAAAFLDHDFWDVSGDEALLISPSGDVKARVEIIGTTPNVSGASPRQVIDSSSSVPSTTSSRVAYTYTYASGNGGGAIGGTGVATGSGSHDGLIVLPSLDAPAPSSGPTPSAITSDANGDVSSSTASDGASGTNGGTASADGTDKEKCVIM